MVLCFYQLLPLLVILIFVLPLFAFKNDNPPKASPKAISRNSGMLTISIDPRLELLAVIQYMSGSKMVFRGGPYSEAIAAWFSKHKDHPLMQRLQEIEIAGYVYDLPVSSFLRFTDCSFTQTSFNWDHTMEAMNMERLKNVEQAGSLDEFYAMVYHFAMQSDFAGFFTSQNEFYRKRVNDVAIELSKHPDMIAHMVTWYGYSHASYTLAISPLVKGGYGPAMADEEGRIHTYCIANIDCSQFSDSDLKHLSHWFFHEFSHSFINPLVAK